MSETHELTAKLIRLLSEEQKGADPAVIAALQRIEERLDKLESALGPTPVAPVPEHVSMERFTIAEAIVDELFRSKEKACTFEPNARPCDNCGMCSSRGF